MTPKQETINRWCNVESINAYADKLHDFAQRERWADRTEIADDLDQASAALRAVAVMVATATHRASTAAYDRLYHRDGAS